MRVEVAIKTTVHLHILSGRKLLSERLKAPIHTTISLISIPSPLIKNITFLFHTCFTPFIPKISQLNVLRAIRKPILMVVYTPVL